MYVEWPDETKLRDLYAYIKKLDQLHRDAFSLFPIQNKLFKQFLKVSYVNKKGTEVVFVFLVVNR